MHSLANKVNALDYYCPSYQPGNKEWRIREIPPPIYYIEGRDELRTPAKMTESFLETLVNKDEGANTPFDPDRLFEIKTELGRNKIDLLLEQIGQRTAITNSNLASLYSDLLKLDNMLLDRPIPYACDTTWLKINEDKLKVYDSIRRELKEDVHANSFTTGELVKALLDYKLGKTKEKILSEGDP